MHVAMQILAAMTATMFLLSAIVHLSGTTDAIAQGLETAPSHFSIHMESVLDVPSKPSDPSTSTILQQIYAALGTDIGEKDRSDGSIYVKTTYEGRAIEDGTYVPMLKASTAPAIEVTDDKNKSGVYYTWILIDIDAPQPSDPSHSPFLHYIIANLDPTCAEKPTVVVSYYPVSPPRGDHRYIGLLFAQPKLADESALGAYEAKFSGNRVSFDVKAYVEHEALVYTKRTYFYSRPHKTSD